MVLDLPNWRCKDITVAQLKQFVEQGSYDFNPKFQRDLRNNSKWKKDLIQSVFTIGVIPPALFHTRDGKLECLDGKQRCMTLLQYFNDEFENTKKKFSELTKVYRDHFRNFKIFIVYTDSTLNENQITHLFAKFQKTQKPTFGELLHSHTGNNIVKRIEVLLDKEKFRKVFHIIRMFKEGMGNGHFVDIRDWQNAHPTETTFQKKETLSLIFHVVYIYKNNAPRLLSSGKIRNILTTDKLSYTDEEIEQALDIFCQLINVIKNIKNVENDTHSPYRRLIKPGVICPLIRFLKVGDTTKKMEWLRFNLNIVFGKWKHQRICNAYQNLHDKLGTLNKMYTQPSKLTHRHPLISKHFKTIVTTTQISEQQAEEEIGKEHISDFSP